MSIVTDERAAFGTFEIHKEIDIDAPIEIVFESVLAELGPEGEMPDGKPFPMKIEPWPGGRWMRDLGNDAGHLWGHIQVIKPPTLIELTGPLMMSFAATNHIQYRLISRGDSTQVRFRHQAMGMITDEMRTGMPIGWQYWVDNLARIAERKMKAIR
jgi:uncharacterized protein YndB with AHSA1/START domain